MADKQAVSDSQCVRVLAEEDVTSRILERKSSEGGFVDNEKDTEKRKMREPSVESEARLKRQIKKDDSGISVEKSENSSEEDASKRSKRTDDQIGEGECRTRTEEEVQFPKLKLKSKNRNYRSKTSGNNGSSDEDAGDVNETEGEEKEMKGKGGKSSPDSGHLENGSAVEDVEMEETADHSNDEPESHSKPFHPLDSDESNDSSDSHCKKRDGGDSDWEDIPSVLLKPKPKHKWFVMQEVVNRQRGVTTRHQGPQLFQQRCYGSLHVVQRLELMYKLEAFHGCVNALHFNSSGTLLASGSDDLTIVVWDWPLGKMVVMYDSGHRSNVFQVKFLPLTGDTHLVSCGRDGQIRMAEMSSTGVCRSTRVLGSHRGPAHKLSILPDTPHVFLSSGEDGLVMSVDVRVPKPHKLVNVQEDGRNIALYSIHSNPLNNNEFCVSGRNNYIRIYDRRKVSSHEELKKFCPSHLNSTSHSAHVTCAVFNYNGTEVMGSYNDEDIYLFDVRNPNGSEYVHKYEGHRNSATVKGLSFFGPRSEFVVSGSDCGNIYFWDKNSEAIVQWMPGDENGVIPVIATSGLDDDVKIWVPSCEQEPKMEGLKSAILSNQKAREDDRQRDPDAFDGQMLWILWRHLQRTERFWQQGGSRREGSTFANRANGQRSSSGSGAPEESSSSDSTNSSDAEDDDHRIQCSPS
ncbi:Protein will die slowly [Gryllus bimaculatus]|nr:Protein will die slowly [Gryllus bimaculatus]